MKINIDNQKAIHYLLGEKYMSEFKVIDGWSQHPQGWNFYDWLLAHGFITQAERTRIDEELEKEANKEEEHMAHINRFS